MANSDSSLHLSATATTCITTTGQQTRRKETRESYLQLTPQDAGATTTTMTNGYLNTSIVHRNGNCLTSTRPTTQNSHPSDPIRRVTMESVVSAAVAGQQWLDVRQGPDDLQLTPTTLAPTQRVKVRVRVRRRLDQGFETRQNSRAFQASESRLCNQTVNNNLPPSMEGRTRCRCRHHRPKTIVGSYYASGCFDALEYNVRHVEIRILR